MSHYTCISLGDYICDECVTPELGRIRGIAFKHKDAPLPDPSSKQDWVNLVCNGYAVVIPEVRGTYDGGAPVDGPGFGETPTRRTSANHTIEYQHLLNCNNVEFYNQLNQNSGKFEFFYCTETKLFRSQKLVYIDAKMPITDDVNSNLEFNVKIMWSNTNLSLCYDRPGLIFDSCQALSDAISCLVCEHLDLNPC